MTNKKIYTAKKWLRFNAIGAMGVGVQFLVTILLTRLFLVGYLAATLLAVQCSLIHNFFWHQRWTWNQVITAGKKQSFRRFVRYNCSTGTISMLGNVGFTALFASAVHLPYMVCNALAIGACNVVNFAFANNFVFHQPEPAA